MPGVTDLTVTAVTPPEPADVPREPAADIVPAEGNLNRCDAVRKAAMAAADITSVPAGSYLSRMLVPVGSEAQAAADLPSADRRVTGMPSPSAIVSGPAAVPFTRVKASAESPALGSGPAVRSWWSAAGRALVGILLAGCGIAIAVTSIRANSWFGHSLTTDPTAGEIFSNLSVLAEIAACIIPTATRFYIQDGDWRTALRGYLLMAVALTVVFFASSGFILNTIGTGVEMRSDRITPAVELAQRTADALSKSRADECRKRGDRCRALEAQERQALADLAAARADVRAQADPQAQVLHVNSNTTRTAQAGAMVALCIAAGYLVAFGAGLVFRSA
jgi:hypothetical protein